jgi:cell division protein FtsA
MNNYICALDIGSSKISAILAQIRKGEIISMYFTTQPSAGVKNGTIVDSIELVEAVGRVIKELKAKSGIKIKSVYTNISGEDMITKHSRGVIPLTQRGSKVITSTDIDKVIEQARILGSNIDDEIIHQLPFSYVVDHKSDIANPIELYGHRLEVDLFLICAKLASVQTITHVLNQAGFEAKELTFSGLATSEAVFSPELKTGTNVICDFGSDITELLIFKDGILRHLQIFPVGGNDFSRVLADSLNIPWSLAEDIKVEQGVIGECSLIREDKEVLIRRDNDYKPIKQRLVCEIITSKAKSIGQTVKDAVEKNVYLSDINNFIVTGRTMQQEGFLESLESTLGISVELGRISHPALTRFLNNNPELSGHKYLAYITALGMVAKGLPGYLPKTSAMPQPYSNNLLARLLYKAREIYQEYF